MPDLYVLIPHAGCMMILFSIQRSTFSFSSSSSLSKSGKATSDEHHMSAKSVKSGKGLDMSATLKKVEEALSG